MSKEVIVSVDGDNGAMVARNPGIRIISNNQAIIPYTDAQNGADGQNARLAVRGAPAGFLAVQLSESNVIPMGIHARVIRYESKQRPPRSVDIPARTDVLFTAIGGDGENGQRGTNGQRGRNGVDSEEATRTNDAKPGSDGGNGGNAGEGTNGADGGDGGDIELYVDEDDTHLLFAVDWAIQGGLGGMPGRHGKPGKGGLGGEGGQGITWDELLGYEYKCTRRCTGFEERSSDISAEDSIVKSNHGVGSRASAPANCARWKPTSLIARAAMQYGAVRHQNNNNNTLNCKCAGGQDSFVGCEPIPIYQKYKRHTALDGRAGMPGSSVQTHLSHRFPGQAGTGTIVVRMRDGRRSRYNSKFNLELVDFEVEDGNGDGIFEPGEYAYVRRIRVRNCGGMPSPKCRIPITLDPSVWFQPVNDSEFQAFILPSIGIGEVATLDEDLKVFIRTNENPPLFGTEFLEQDTLSISAHMPWLDRALPHFEYSQIIDIQYPVAFRRFNFLKSLAQGSENRFTFEVYNKDTKALGSGAFFARTVEIISSFDGDFGHLRSNAGDWREQVAHGVSHIDPLGTAIQSRRINILPDAQNYSHVNINLGLCLADSIQERTIGEKAPEERSLIQRETLRVQIASHHRYNTNSAFLLVTTSESTRPCVQAIKDFIQNDLNLEADEWNISLYGGLQYAAEEDQGQSVDATIDATVQYYGKSIVFLGDSFEFFGKQNRNAVKLCDARVLAEACIHGTSCLFLRSSRDQSLGSLFRSLAFPVQSSIPDLAERMNESQKFFSGKAFIESVEQIKSSESQEFHLSTVPIPSRWYRLGSSNPDSEAKKFARYLQQRLPQERFLIVPANEADIGRQEADLQRDSEAEQASKFPLGKHRKADRGALIVLHGCPHRVSAMATESSSGKKTGFSLSNSNRLLQFDALMLVQSLPVSQRVEILWALPDPMSADSDGRLSDKAIRCIFFSVLLEVDREVHTFLSRSTWPNRISFPKDAELSGTFAQMHFPVLSKLLQYHGDPSPIRPPEKIVEILQHAEASTLPQKKRHIVRTTLMPVAQRRRQTRKFFKSLIDSVLHQHSYTDEDCNQFHREAKSLHSYTHSQKCRTSEVILKRVGKFTKKTVYQYRMAHCTASTIVPRTTYCTDREWQEQLDSIEMKRARIVKETQHAREVLGRMVLDAARENEH